MARFKLQIDHLPDEDVYALKPAEAAKKAREILDSRGTLKELDDDDPMQLKLPNGTLWGRNLSVSDYRTDVIDSDEPHGPVLDPIAEQVLDRGRSRT